MDVSRWVSFMLPIGFRGIRVELVVGGGDGDR